MVSVGDVDALSEAIKKVASFSDDEIRKFGEAARFDILQLCGEENTVKKLIETIEKV